MRNEEVGRGKVGIEEGRREQRGGPGRSPGEGDLFSLLFVGIEDQ